MSYEESKGDFLSIDEACRLLGCQRRTLDHYAERGMLTKYYVGLRRRLVFQVSDVQRLKNQLDTPSEER